jgi:flagellar protein FliO/FliZ
MILSSLGGSIYQFVVVLVIFIGVLFLTAFATKWIANYMHNQNSNPYSNFEVIDTYNMGPNHRLMILKVGKNKYYTIALGKETVTFIGELTEEELKDRSGIQTPSRNFNDILKKFHLDKQAQSK